MSAAQKWILEKVTHRWCDCNVSCEQVHVAFPQPTMIEPLTVMAAILQGKEVPKTFLQAIHEFCRENKIEYRVDDLSRMYNFKRRYQST